MLNCRTHSASVEVDALLPLPLLSPPEEGRASVVMYSSWAFLECAVWRTGWEFVVLKHQSWVHMACPLQLWWDKCCKCRDRQSREQQPGLSVDVFEVIYCSGCMAS